MNFLHRNIGRKNWYFECTCVRCVDPRELGTCVSGVTCAGCGDTLLPR